MKFNAHLKIGRRNDHAQGLVAAGLSLNPRKKMRTENKPSFFRNLSPPPLPTRDAPRPLKHGSTIQQLAQIHSGHTSYVYIEPWSSGDLSPAKPQSRGRRNRAQSDPICGSQRDSSGVITAAFQPRPFPAKETSSHLPVSPLVLAGGCRASSSAALAATAAATAATSAVSSSISSQ